MGTQARGTLLFSLLFIALLAFGGGWISSWALGRAQITLPFLDGPIMGPSGAAIVGEADTDMALFWEAMRLLEDNYYSPDELPRGPELTYAAVEGLMKQTADPHTAFMNPERAEQMAQQLSGSFEGIGSEVDMGEQGLVIVSPYPGSPAERAGLQPGDIVAEVDGVPTQGMTVDEAASRVRGPAGTMVRLLIQREGLAERFEIEVQRARIIIPVVESRMIEAEGAPRIGYLRLFSFSSGSSSQLERELQALRDQGAEALIFDLRNNPGGFLVESVAITSEFIDEGIVLSEKGSNDRDRTHPAEPGGIALDLPMVLLVNEGSASASEIVAGALQDAGRATIIGVTTFGKGSVQVTHGLSDGSSIRVTVARWFTPGGRAIHEVGIEPDIVVERPADAPPEQDPQLDEAVRVLRGER